MKIDVVYPHLPPAADAIGEHTVLLARHLADRADVRVLHVGASDVDPAPEGWATRSLGQDTRAIGRLVDVCRERGADWLLLQYNPFSYGRYGFAPRLVGAVRSLLRREGAPRLALLAHEPFSPFRGIKGSLMATAQREQFRALGRFADTVLLPTEPWVDEFAPWFPRANTGFMPIGSNIPRRHVDRARARARLGLPDSHLVVVLFGGLGNGRNPELVTRAAAILAGTPCTFLYVGPSSATFTACLEGLDVAARALGRLPADEVSAALQAADLGLAPFADGVSARRSSFLALLQHGVPTVTTSGPWTGSTLVHEGTGKSFVATSGKPIAVAEAVLALAADAPGREALGCAAAAYYEHHHTWRVVADRVLEALETREQRAARV